MIQTFADRKLDQKMSIGKEFDVRINVPIGKYKRYLIEFEKQNILFKYAFTWHYMLVKYWLGKKYHLKYLLMSNHMY